MKKGYYVLVILLIVLGTSFGFFYFFYYKTPMNNNDLKTLKVIEDSRSLVNLPVYLAVFKGFFEEENLKIHLTTAKKGEEPLEIIQEGKNSDIFLCGPEEIIYQYQINNNSKYKYFYNLSRHEGSYLISKEALPFLKPNMMSKKTILGSPRGTLWEMVLEKYLQNNQLIPQRSLNIIQTLSTRNKLIAFESGSGNYILISEPEASRIILENKGFNMVSLADKIPSILNKGLITSDEYINNHQKELLSFTKAIYKSQQWILSKPIEDYIDQIKSYFPEFTREELIMGIQNYKELSIWTNDPTPSEEKFRVLETIMDSAGELRKPSNPQLFIEKKITLQAVEIINNETAKPR